MRQTMGGVYIVIPRVVSYYYIGTNTQLAIFKQNYFLEISQAIVFCFGYRFHPVECKILQALYFYAGYHVQLKVVNGYAYTYNRNTI